MNGTTAKSALGEVLLRSQVRGKLDMKAGWTETVNWSKPAEDLVAAYKVLLGVHQRILADIGRTPPELQREFDTLDAEMAELEKTHVTNTSEARDAHAERVNARLAAARTLLGRVEEAIASNPESEPVMGAVAQGTGGSPPPEGDKPPGKPPPEAPARAVPALKDQNVVWNLAPVVYGTALNALPGPVIAEGNRQAAITCEPPLDDRTPQAGELSIFVSVPGNSEFRPVTRKEFVLQVGQRPLLVSVNDAETAAGRAAPPLTYTADGLAAQDVLQVEFAGAPTAASAPRLDGYEVSPVLTFARGDAANYAITLQPGRVVVTRSFSDMDAEITRLRHGSLDVASAEDRDLLLKRLDIIEKRRDNRDAAPAALEQELRALDKELYEATYIPVALVTVSCATGAVALRANETLQFNATVAPENATQPGVSWGTDQPDLVTVSAAGQVSRAPGSLAGGKAVIRATSLSREKIPGAMVIDVVPLPASLRIAAPTRVFLKSEHQITAQIEPIDAPQEVTWSYKGRSALVKLSPDGKLAIGEPQPGRSQSIPRKVEVGAASKARPAVAEAVEIELAGYAVEGIRIEGPSPRDIKIGVELTFRAVCVPSGASEEVEWQFAGDGVGKELGHDLRSITLRLENPGEVELTAMAADGSGVSARQKFGVPVPMTALAIDAPKTSIDFSETIVLTPRFDPPAARTAVTWSSSKPAVLTVDNRGTIKPAGRGKATVTGTAGGKTASVGIEVSVSGGTSITSEQWDATRALIDKYAAKIGITDSQPAKKAYDGYIYELRQSIMGAATTGGATKTLATVRVELIDLRDTHFRLEHAVWLQNAGFKVGSDNCMIRECGKVALASMTFEDVHLTLFDTRAQLAIGRAPDALVSATLRAKLKGMSGLHVTAYASGKDQQLKVYNSGERWYPPRAHIAAWVAKWDPKANYDEFIERVRGELTEWFEDQKPDRIAALTNYYNDVKRRDGDEIA